MSTTTAPPAAGRMLREWRMRRKRSQMDLALDAEISTRHLSFVETGRASASREMLLRLAEHLDMPLRQRNQLLLAAGFAPRYAERPLQAPDMAAARAAVEALLEEVAAYPCPPLRQPLEPGGSVAVPLRLRGPGGAVLSFLSTTTVFGTPVDVTLAELALECFYPADEATRHALTSSSPAQEIQP